MYVQKRLSAERLAGPSEWQCGCIHQPKMLSAGRMQIDQNLLGQPRQWAVPKAESASSRVHGEEKHYLKQRRPRRLPSILHSFNLAVPWGRTYCNADTGTLQRIEAVLSSERHRSQFTCSFRWTNSRGTIVKGRAN